jgi:Rhodopirellula transposase DDE domain
LQELVAPETAGDPLSEQKWVRSSLRTLSARLCDAGHAVSAPTVGRLLKGLGYALHVNAKQLEARSQHPDRHAQFDYLAQQRQAFTAAGRPIISVDTKKKELIGPFKNAGQAWSRAPAAVNVHDFLSEAAGRAVPYGIYDLTHNRGTVYVGTSGDTAQFAVDAIAQWWQTQGQAAFAPGDHLLILADGGGSNGCRARRWKQQIQEHLCDGLGLTVTVCHYPPGCSKWNPIEHRLFGPISVNWAGKPLRTVDHLLAYVRGTTTATGLTVQAGALDGDYPTGQRVSDAEMEALQVSKHAVCPAWNYTIAPRRGGATSGALMPPKEEVIV